jgi:hypothetical protein
MSAICPRSRPQQMRSKTLEMLRESGLEDGVFLLGVRGYYLDSMGEPGENDLSIYDDAVFLISPRLHLGFNANTDPSRHYTLQKPLGMATLSLGVWHYRLGIHGLSRPKAQQYEALVQSAPVQVERYQGEDKPPKRDTGYFGINIHRGGYNGTSSEGCQTIYPDQWQGFIGAVKDEMEDYGQKTIAYLLTENL